MSWRTDRWPRGTACLGGSSTTRAVARAVARTAALRNLVIRDTITLGEEVAHYGPGSGPPTTAFGQPWRGALRPLTALGRPPARTSAGGLSPVDDIGSRGELEADRCRLRGWPCAASQPHRRSACAHSTSVSRGPPSQRRSGGWRKATPRALHWTAFQAIGLRAQVRLEPSRGRPAAFP